MQIYTILPPVLILFVAIVFRLFPPKNINYLYGYRTVTSMKTKHTWREANRYSANLMVLFSIINIVSGVLLEILMQKGLAPFIWNLGLLVVLLILVVVLTEIRLKKLFGENGEPRETQR